MKRQIAGGKRTLPRAGGKRTLPRRLKPVNLKGLPPAVIGGVEGGHVCERCGRTVPADEMTAGGQNCRECGHPARHRELRKKELQRAKAIHDDFRVYHEQHPGSPRGIQHLERILWLVGRCHRNEPTLQETLETLSDEELDLAIRALSDEVLAELA